MEFMGMYDAELYSMDSETCGILLKLMDDVIARHLMKLFESPDFQEGKTKDYGSSLVGMEEMLKPKVITITLIQRLEKVKVSDRTQSVVETLKNLPRDESIYDMVLRERYNIKALDEVLDLILENKDNIFTDIPARDKTDWLQFFAGMQMVSVRAFHFHQLYGYPFNPNMVQVLRATKDIFYTQHEVARKSGLGFLQYKMPQIFKLKAYTSLQLYLKESGYKGELLI